MLSLSLALVLLCGLVAANAANSYFPGYQLTPVESYPAKGSCLMDTRCYECANQCSSDKQCKAFQCEVADGGVSICAIYNASSSFHSSCIQAPYVYLKQTSLFHGKLIPDEHICPNDPDSIADDNTIDLFPPLSTTPIRIQRNQYKADHYDITHVIPSFCPEINHSLHASLDTTAKTLLIAQDAAQREDITVQLIFVVTEADVWCVPSHADVVVVQRQINDNDLLIIPPPSEHFYLQDLIEVYKSVGKGDIFVLTNSDISVKPHFYIINHKMLNGDIATPSLNRLGAFITKTQEIGFFEDYDDLDEILNTVGQKRRCCDVFSVHKDVVPYVQTGLVILPIPPFGYWLAGVLSDASHKAGYDATLVQSNYLTFHLEHSRSHRKQSFDALRPWQLLEVMKSDLIAGRPRHDPVNELGAWSERRRHQKGLKSLFSNPSDLDVYLAHAVQVLCDYYRLAASNVRTSIYDLPSFKLDKKKQTNAATGLGEEEGIDEYELH